MVRAGTPKVSRRTEDSRGQRSYLASVGPSAGSRNRAAERELEVLRSYRERIEELERDKETLLESYVDMAPEALESLAPEERHQIYKMLRLQVLADADGRSEVTGALMTAPEVCRSGAAPQRS